MQQLLIPLETVCAHIRGKNTDGASSFTPKYLTWSPKHWRMFHYEKIPPVNNATVDDQ